MKDEGDTRVANGRLTAMMSSVVLSSEAGQRQAILSLHQTHVDADIRKVEQGPESEDTVLVGHHAPQGGELCQLFWCEGDLASNSLPIVVF